MTNDEMRVAVAESLGWKRNPLYDVTNPQSSTTIPQPKVGFEAWVEPASGRLVWSNELPNYPADLNAIHEAEGTLKGIEQRDYLENLYQIVGSGGHCISFRITFPQVHATAAQRCEAYLRVKGLWKD